MVVDPRDPPKLNDRGEGPIGVLDDGTVCTVEDGDLPFVEEEDEEDDGGDDE